MSESDDEYVSAIAQYVLKALRVRGFFNQLDDLLSPKKGTPKKCHGDFRYSKQILRATDLKKSDWDDVFIVLQSRGGCCDCEVLYNVAGRNRFKSKYWKARYAQLAKKPLP